MSLKDELAELEQQREVIVTEEHDYDSDRSVQTTTDYDPLFSELKKAALQNMKFEKNESMEVDQSIKNE